MSYPPWSDLDDDRSEPSLVPPMGTRKAPGAAPVAIMVSAAPDLNYIRSGFGAFQTTPFLNSSLFAFDGRNKGICVAGPYIGAPYGAMILESLIARGAEKVLIIGWCGSIHPDIRTGDVIIPDSAFVHEGTSVNYQQFDQAPWTTRPSDAFTGTFIQWCRGQNQGMDIKTGPVWTTDAIYRETAPKVAYFRNLGALAVEMECSALFSVAAYRQVEITALLVVSDSLAAFPDIPGWQPGFRTTAFKQARKKACDMVMTFAGDLLQNEH